MVCNHTSYGQAIICGNQDDFDLVQSKINARKKPPTDKQIEALRQFLKGFGFKGKIHIPQFNTFAELDSWKKQQIKNKLGY